MNNKGEKILKKDKITICITDPNTNNVIDQIDTDVPDMFNIFDVCDLCNEHEDDDSICENCIVNILQREKYIHKEKISPIDIMEFERKFISAINIINNCRELDVNIDSYKLLKKLIPEIDWDKFKNV
jgi:hypothetical protein